MVFLIPIFNYNYPWKLSDRFSNTRFNKLVVHEMYSKKEYSITNENNVNLLYEYITKQRGRKYFSWLSGGLHGLFHGDENYTLTFMAKQESSEFINLLIMNNKGYLNFTDGFYRLDSRKFNIEKFRKFLK
jgi:hypothetical protein